MDPARAGYCRAGYARAGVYRPDWDNKVLPSLEKVPAKTLGGKTPCIQGSAKQGMTRHNVKVPLFDEALQNLKKGK